MKRSSRIRKLLEHIGSDLQLRHEPLTLLILAAVAGEGVFLLGPPGVAKSLLARRLESAFAGARGFVYLMHRFSTPDELFGPVSISRLKDDDVYERMTLHYLPEADVIFLDEIWQAGSSIRNTLLTVLNEKMFRNGEREICVPMKAFVAASNHVPEPSGENDALWDRFLLRYLIEPLREANAFSSMLIASVPLKVEDSPHAISSDEYAIWQSELVGIEVPRHVLSSIDAMRIRLEQGGDENFLIHVSDRRWHKIIHLLRASAYLNDRLVIEPVDMLLITHCLWNQPQQREQVHAMVQETIMDQGLMEYYGVQKLADRVYAHLYELEMPVSDLGADMEDKTIFYRVEGLDNRFPADSEMGYRWIRIADIHCLNSQGFTLIQVWAGKQHPMYVRLWARKDENDSGKLWLRSDSMVWLACSDQERCFPIRVVSDSVDDSALEQPLNVSGTWRSKALSLWEEIEALARICSQRREADYASFADHVFVPAPQAEQFFHKGMEHLSVQMEYLKVALEKARHSAGL